MATFRARILATAGGVAVHNVLHVSAGEAAEQDVADDLADAWRTKIVNLLPANYAFAGVEVQNIATDDIGSFSAGTTGPTQGTNANPSLPSWVCASVRLRTSRRGRAGAGRLGIGPIPESYSDTAGNVLIPEAVSAVGTTVTNLMDDLASSARNAPMTLVVVSYYKGVDALGKPIKRATPLITQVESISVNAVMGSRLSRHPNR